ncbi:DUF3108 domain-containing protein [Flavobacteriales bacterium]|jgi:hypothetical protein|nr:DUF3108 domain-containing protein [Flavobacteriales bacterium]
MFKRLVLILLFTPFLAFPQKEIPYQVGEYSAFDIFFGSIIVGHAELEIVEEKFIDSISTFHIVGKGKTAYFFDWFFKVRDVYETFLDTSTLLPIKFIRDINEGPYSKKQNYFFHHSDSVVKHNDTTYEISYNSQDMLSALFYARTFNKGEVKKKNSFFVPIFMDEENYFLEVTYLNNEVIETEFGKVDCLVFKPQMQEGRVFEDGEEMKIWISNDKNLLLVKVETKIWSGTIKAVLVDYKELKFPLSIIQ